MAVESLVGGAFLSASLQVLFDRLASREVVNLFRKRRSNVDGFLKKLKMELNLVNGVLDDAEFKQFTDKTVKDWLDEARDAVYEADDVLSEIAYEALRCKVEADHEYKSISSKIKSLILSCSTSFDQAIEPKLQDIIELLKDLSKAARILGLEKGVRHGNAWNRSSSSVVVEADVYGRDSEKEELTKLLISDETSGANNEVGVIPVVGMGGLGKTTIVQLAYNDGEVDEHFDLKAWVCVTQEFDVFRITKSILESITTRACGSTDLNQVQESLKEELEGRKFLVVLDDVWNENYRVWDMLRTPFRTGASGSKIIVTSRSQNTAAIVKTGPVIQLTELSDEDCWSLFAKIAFKEMDPLNYPLLEAIGRKIVNRCRGLPLAAKSLAGLLRSKLDVEEWDDILKSEFWDLPEDKSDILPALRLSYHYLPSHLKQCFAFCSLFPKNYTFYEEKIVSLWIAQKFVLPQGGKSCEIQGKKCFRELLSMSFFQPSRSRESCFVMHDLMHDLAQVVSGEFSFRLGQLHSTPIKARHFSCYQGTACQQLQLVRVNGLRTLLHIGSVTPIVKLDNILSRQKHLRVLSLQCNCISEVPGLIGSLMHLNYLDLSHTSIKQLPESVCRLYNLDTLLLVECSRFTNLPVEIGKLLSLRKLDVTGTKLTEMPMQMSQLKGLEHLTKFVVGNCSGLGIEGLKALSNLRGPLEISGLENVRVSKDALEAKLNEKEHLETLHLEWGLCGVTDNSQYEREVLEYLRPHTNLKKLTITRYRGTRFPGWLGDHLFSEMVYLRLQDCKNCYELPSLGQLACLTELFVEGMSNVTELGPDFYGSCSGISKPFPSLERLTFRKMSKWVEWHLPGRGEFPKLRQLNMFDCPVLAGGLDNQIERFEHSRMSQSLN